MACSGELEFEAPLARFDVEEWTEFYEENDGSSSSSSALVIPATAVRGKNERHSRLKAIGYHSDDELMIDDGCGSRSMRLITAPPPLSPPRGLQSSGSSCGSGNFAEHFGETCLSGSLEDLVNTFDESVTKCCKSYEERVEQLAPVQVRTEDDLVEDCSQNWYTLTGTYGSLLPINWSHTRTQKTYGACEEDIEDDEELSCLVDEVDFSTGDLLNSLKPSAYEDEELSEALDNADDVICELEALMEEREIEIVESSLSLTSPASVTSARSIITTSNTQLLSDPVQTDANVHVWLRNDVNKLSVTELKQSSADLTRAIVDCNNALRQELTISDELKYQNRLSRDFISLTLNLQRKRHQLEQPSADTDDEDLDLIKQPTVKEGMYLSTVIPYRPSDGQPTIQRLQIYITLLLAIEEDSMLVPRLLTDYILNVLCPVN